MRVKPQTEQKEKTMDKGLSSALNVIDLWVRAILGALESTVFLPFNFLSALFNF